MADPTVTHESETVGRLSAIRLDESLTDGPDWPLVWISLTAALGTYLAAAAALSLVIDFDTAALRASAAARLGVLPHLPEFMRPEPLERARYLLGLACIPLLPTVAFVAALRLVPPGLRDWCNRPGPLVARDAILLGVFTAWFCGLGLASRVPNSGLLMLAALPIAGFFVLAGGAFDWAPRWLAWAVVLAMAILCVATQSVSDNWFFHRNDICHHIDIILGAVNQVGHGRTVLVDVSSQYGLLYPYVIAALMTPFGITMTGLTVVFGSVVLLQGVLLYLAASRLPGMTAGWRAAFAVCCASVCVPMLQNALFVAPDSLFLTDIRTTDIQPAYFQFTPIRTLWLAVFVWLLSCWSQPLHRSKIAAGYLLAGVALLWNADSGLVVLGAWAATLVACGAADWRAAPGRLALSVGAHAAAVAGTAAAALAAYAAFACWRSGHWPDFEQLLRFQAIFYGAGFFMVPMPVWEWWQPIVALHACTIAWALRQVVCGRIPPTAALKLFTAVYGLGAFSYYQGRSMPSFLPSTFLPAMLLAFIWVREGMAVLSLRRPAEIVRRPELRIVAVCTLPMLMFLLALGLNLGRSLPAAVRYACDTTGPIDSRELAPIWDALRPHLSGRAVAVLTDPSAYIHAKTGSWSALPVANTAEVFLQSQLAEIESVLAEPGMLVVVQADLLPAWAKQLDLSNHQDVAEIPGGFRLLRRQGTATQAAPGTGW